MKYIVEVNAKYLVSIEANSLIDAEHRLLGYNGVWGALAFDRAMMKTDTFAGAVQGCEMISMIELEKMVNEMMEAKKEAVAKLEAKKEAAKKVEELKAALEAAENDLFNANREEAGTKFNYEAAEKKLGKQRI